MRSAFVLCVILSCVIASVLGQSACTYKSSSGTVYDLSSLTNKGPYGGSYVLSDPTGYQYWVNFCAPVSTSGCGSQSTVCQLASGGYYNLGTTSGSSWSEAGGQVRFQYLTGDYCSVVGRPRYSYFFLNPDCNANSVTLTRIYESPTCTYNFFITIPCQSVVVPNAPAAPVLNLTANPADSLSVILSWPSVPSATSYRLYRKASTESLYSMISQNAVSPFTNSGLVSEVEYTYYALAVNSAGNSAASNYVSYKRTAPKLEATVRSTPVLCYGEATGSANVQVTAGNGPFTYSWSSGATTAVVYNLAAGTYTVRVTGAAGVSRDFSVVVAGPSSPLTLTIGSRSDATYFGGADGSATLVANGGTPGYYYMWEGSESESATANGLAAGSYVANVTDSNDCFAEVEFIISQPAPLSAEVVSTTDAKCHGANTGKATVAGRNGNAFGNYEYLWDNGQTTATATGLTAGTHTVRVSDASGHIDVQVTIGEPSALVVAPHQTDATLWGKSDASASVDVSGGTPAYTYLWSTGATTSIISGVAAGNYSVTVTDANMCTAFQAFTLSQPMWCYVSVTPVKVNTWQSNGVTYSQWNLNIKNVGTPQLITLRIALSGPTITSQWNINNVGGNKWDVSIWNGLSSGATYNGQHGLIATGTEDLVATFVDDSCYPAAPPGSAVNAPPATCTASVTANRGSDWVDNNVKQQAYTLNIQNSGSQKIKTLTITFNSGATVVSSYNLNSQGNNNWGVAIWSDGLDVGQSYNGNHGFVAAGNYVLVPAVVSVTC